jgi:hypothetical protein
MKFIETVRLKNLKNFKVKEVQDFNLITSPEKSIDKALLKGVTFAGI